jgi:hypothetical protein
MITFLEAAAEFVPVDTQLSSLKSELATLTKLIEEEDKPTPDDPPKRDVKPGEWAALFDGKNFKSWKEADGIPKGAKDGWSQEKGVLIGTRGDDTEGQFGVGLGRPDVTMVDFDVEIDVEVDRGTLYLIVRTGTKDGQLAGQAIPIGPKGGRKKITTRVLGREMCTESPALPEPQKGRMQDTTPKEGSVLLLLDRASSAKIHSIRYRPLK